MNKSNIHHLSLVRQDTKDGIFTMKGMSLERLLHNIIREYGYYHDGSYAVDINTLSLSDKKLLISHVTDAEEYEWACATPSRTEAVFKEYADHIQNLVDDECYPVYKENMEEMGMCEHRHYDNNEPYWVRR